MAQSDPYCLGRDRDETERLERQSFRFIEAAGGWHYHPSLGDLSQFKSILDCGAGSLAWTRSILDGGTSSSHPVRLASDCKVEACDISDTQFSYKPQDGLSDLYLHDVTKPFPDAKQNKYDLINQRFLVGGPSIEQWPAIIKNLKGALRNGGYVNVSELDFEPKSLDGRPLPPSLSRFFYLARSVQVKLGKNTFIARDYPTLLGAAGFVDVQTYAYPFSWGHAGCERLGFVDWLPSETARLKEMLRNICEGAVKLGALREHDGEDIANQFDAAMDEMDRFPTALTGYMTVAKKASPASAS